jgi:hypothetical protein
MSISVVVEKQCFGLVFFSLPHIVWTLSPAVGTCFVNAALAFQSIEFSAPAHKQIPTFL